jgi:hypothetical protein
VVIVPDYLLGIIVYDDSFLGVSFFSSVNFSKNSSALWQDDYLIMFLHHLSLGGYWKLD